MFDAISDPLVGSISDRCRSKLGRRHPFLFFAPLPIALFIYLIYSPPASLSGVSLFVWLTSMTISFRLMMTCFSIPHVALGAELTADFLERSSVMGYNMLFASIGTMSTVFIGYNVFFTPSPEYANGLLDALSYPEFALVMSVIGGTIMFASAAYLARLIPYLPKPEPGIRLFNIGGFFQDIWDAIKNPNYLALLLGSLLLSMMTGTKEALSNHMFTYFWTLTPAEIQYVPIASLIGTLVSFWLTPRLHRVFDKGTVVAGAVFGASLVGAIPVTLRTLGFYPDNESAWLLPCTLLYSGSFLALLIAASITVMSALADVADQHELNTQRRQEGIFYSARSFFTKASSGFGLILAGLAIDIIGFPVGAKVEDVPQVAVMQLGLFEGPAIAMAGVLACVIYRRYALTRDDHMHIQKALASVDLKSGRRRSVR